MTDEITCPAEGCDYSNVAESVAGHAQAKRDAPHKGISYRNVMDEHSGNGSESRQSSTSGSSPSSTSTNGDNPTVGSGDSGGGTQADTGGSDAVELPCGHESFDPAEAPDTPFVIGCETCGETWQVEDD